MFRQYLLTVTTFFLLISLSNLEGTEATSDSTARCRPLSEIKSGKLRIGVYNDDPYFSYVDPDTKKLAGFDADMARALTQEIMGDADKADFVIIDSEKRLEVLRDSKADMVIAELSMTDNRRDVVDFSDIYYVAGQSILVNVDSPFYSLEDLRGQTIGAAIGTTNEKHVKALFPNSKFIFFPSLSSGFQALKNRTIQALCIDDVMLIALKTHPQRILLDYRFVGGEISWENYGIAVNKGCYELLEAINQALKKIKADGRWQQIYDRNIGSVSRVSAGPPT